MYSRFRPLMKFCKAVVQSNLKVAANFHYKYLTSCNFDHLSSLSNLIKFYAYHTEHDRSSSHIMNGECFGQSGDSVEQPTGIDKLGLRVQDLLSEYSKSSNEELVEALENCEISLTEELVLNVLKRHDSDWKPAFQFFNWVSSVSDESGYIPRCEAYNKMLGILGKAKKFKEVIQVFDEMFKRGMMNEGAYDVVVHRYAAAHKTDDAIAFFYKRKKYGLELDLRAFQVLLMSLCRYKHVEIAEALFHLKKREFEYDIKTWNILLNGWFVLGSLHHTKKFWFEILRSKCKPDKYTYGTYINALCRSGKVSTALNLFRGLWKKGIAPDVAMCNSVIDGLCFKKRIPEAIQLLNEINARGCCKTNVGTYNCLIKHMCKNRRMDAVYQLLDEMENKGGECTPNSRTYIYLLTTAKTPDEVSSLLERMKIKGCNMTEDTYNLVLRLYLSWNCEELVHSTWAAMLRDGMGPDRRSYTVMIHKRYGQGRVKEALGFYRTMTAKGMIPEPMTEYLVKDMKNNLGMGKSKDPSTADCRALTNKMLRNAR